MKLGAFLVLAVIFGIALLSACKKDEKVNPPDPNKSLALEAKSAEVFPDGGVKLTGSINKIPDSLKSYGFIIATDSLLQTDRVFVPATSAAVAGDFVVSANTGLTNNKKYYYSPFYSINPLPGTTGVYATYVTYNVKSFVSGGSKLARIDTIYPLNGVRGDTVTLKGKFLPAGQVNIFFDNHIAGFIANKISDTLIQVVVPEEVSNLKSAIGLRMNGAIFATNKTFTLSAPIITAYTQNVTFGDTVTINGDQMGLVNDDNEVSFGNIKATVVSSSKKKITVIVPNGVTSINSDISLTAQFQQILAPGKFHIARPVITSVTTAANTGDMITVAGKNFDPLIEKNILYFENLNVSLYSSATSQLRAILPAGPFPRRKAAVKLQFLDTTVTYSQDIVVKDTWIMAATSPFLGSTATGSFTINGTLYVVAPENQGLGVTTKYLWKFSPADYSWQRNDIPFSFGDGKLTATASKAYLYTTGIVNNFWEYDPSLNTWTQKATYPMGERDNGSMFAIGNQVYLGMGSQPNIYGGSIIPDNTFYQYDTGTDTWTRKADYPADGSSVTGLLHGASFILGGKAYVFGQSTIQNYGLVYTYDPSTDSWQKQSSHFDSNTQGNNAFVYNGNGYVFGSLCYTFPSSTYLSCYKYVPGTDTWTQLPDDIAKLIPQISPDFVYVNNGTIYVGSGPIFVTSVSNL